MDVIASLRDHAGKPITLGFQVLPNVGVNHGRCSWLAQRKIEEMILGVYHLIEIRNVGHSCRIWSVQDATLALQPNPALR